MSQLAAQTDRLDALLGALAAQAERLPGGVQRWALLGAGAVCGAVQPSRERRCAARRCVLCGTMTCGCPVLPPCRKPSKDGGVLLHELTLTTPRGEQTLCKGLSLALAPGQSLLIVGPSGVGKTSIMRAVAGEAAQPGAGEGSPWGAISSTSATTEAQRAWQPGAEQAR